MTAAQDESMRTRGGYGDRDGNDSRECTCEPYHFSEPKPAELSGIRLQHSVVEFLDAELTIPWDSGCVDGLATRLPSLSRWCEMSPRLSFQRRDLTFERTRAVKHMEVLTNDDVAEPCRSLFFVAAEEPRGSLSWSRRPDASQNSFKVPNVKTQKTWEPNGEWRHHTFRLSRLQHAPDGRSSRRLWGFSRKSMRKAV